jgi:histidyl-tRNA synthetase
MEFKSPPGVNDIIPINTSELWKSSYLWNFAENIMRKVAFEYGLQEIRTPLFEKTELFQRGIGETSDIVTKEMYTFVDRGGRSLTLRPEGTAPVIRALLENKLLQAGSSLRLYYICPMFRYERSQAGRYRQHHQFGVEVIGSDAPETDAELIDMAYTLYTRLGIKGLTVSINSIGVGGDRARYKTALKEYLHKHLNDLSADSKVRFEKNPLRILDSKDPQDQEIVRGAPNILDFLDDHSKAHFEKLKSLLTDIGIPFQVNPLLVRGLDYYNKTVFEIISTHLGSQNSIGGGGRYDGLIQELGGPDLPSSGFGSGIERILQTLIAQNAPLPSPPSPTLFMIPLGDAAKQACFVLQKQLRDAHIPVQMDFSGKKLGKLMALADSLGATYAAVIGDEELKSGTITLKEMKTGMQYKVPTQNLPRILQVEDNSGAFISLWQEMARPFESPLEAEFFIKKINKSIQDTTQLTETLHKALLQMQDALK